jgi:hypothetical protein
MVPWQSSRELVGPSSAYLVLELLNQSSFQMILG